MPTTAPRSVPCSTGSMGQWRPSPAMAPTTATTSTPRLRPAIPPRPWLCRRARMRCRAKPRRSRRRSGTPIYDASPSAGAWAGGGCRGTTGALWWRLTSRDGNASSVTGCASRRTSVRRVRWPSRPTYLYQLILDLTDGIGCLSRCGCRLWSCRHEFLLGQGECVKKGLHRGLAETPAALMRPALVVLGDPSIEIGLQLVDRAVDLLAERHPIELVEHGAMETLADAVGLRALGLGAGVVDVLDRQVELVFVAVAAAELGAAVGQHARQPDAVLVIERHDPVIEDLGRGDRCLTVIQLGKGHLGVGVDDTLLVDPPDPLQRADREGVLRAAVAGAFAVELAVRLLVGLGLFQGGNLRFGQQDTLLRRLGFERLEAQLHRGQVVALPDAAHPGRRDRQAAPL